MLHGAGNAALYRQYRGSDVPKVVMLALERLASSRLCERRSGVPACEGGQASATATIGLNVRCSGGRDPRPEIRACARIEEVRLAARIQRIRERSRIAGGPIDDRGVD